MKFMRQAFQRMKTRLPHKVIALLLGTAFILSACGAGSTAVVQPTPSSAPEIIATSTPEPEQAPTGYVEYFTQSGDTLPVIAAHFGVRPDQIISDNVLDSEKILAPGIRLFICDLLGETSQPDILFPDSEFVFSRSAIGFDIQVFADEKGGYLATYKELMTRGTTLAPDILNELAVGHSINPRLLLTLIEYESGWVTRQPETKDEKLYPMGWIKSDRAGIYFQTGLLIRQLLQGYYGWRAGILNEITFLDGSTLRLSPFLNAGTVGVMYALAQYHDRAAWEAALYGIGNIVEVQNKLFGDAWVRALRVEPLFETGVEQPVLNLPIPVNQKWALTNGPHTAWGLYGPLAALDFAPAGNIGCDVSKRFTLAAAAGRVVRAGNGVVVLDLDEDGYEQTGWVLVYMHVSSTDRVKEGDYLKLDDPIGHPSCEGGSASGSHIHIARKYNGEWVLADGGLPFVLSGYQAHKGEKDCNGDRFCEGTLDNGERTIVADAYGNSLTITIRPESLPKYFFTPTPKND